MILLGHGIRGARLIIEAVLVERKMHVFQIVSHFLLLRWAGLVRRARHRDLLAGRLRGCGLLL